jgi:hypothetical protein
VKDKFGAIYTVDNFYGCLQLVGENIKAAKLKPNSSAYKPIVTALEDSMKGEFQL